MENALAIPLNIPLGLAIAEVVAETGIPVIAHHHDFSWERQRFAVNSVGDYLAAAFPPSLPSVRHVVINSVQAQQLATRTGLNSQVIPNVMDFDRPPRAAGRLRARRARRPGRPRRRVLHPPADADHPAEGDRARDRADPAARTCPPRWSSRMPAATKARTTTERVREFAQLLDVHVRFESELVTTTRDAPPTAAHLHAGRHLPAGGPGDLPVEHRGLRQRVPRGGLPPPSDRREPLLDLRDRHPAARLPRRRVRQLRQPGDIQETRRLLEHPALGAEWAETNYELARRHFSFGVLERGSWPCWRSASGNGDDAGARPGRSPGPFGRPGPLRRPPGDRRRRAGGRPAGRLIADAGHEVRVSRRGADPRPAGPFVRLPLLDPRHPVDRAPAAGPRRRARPRRLQADGRRPSSAELAPSSEGVDIVIAHNVCSLRLNLALTAALPALADRRATPPDPVAPRSGLDAAPLPIGASRRPPVGPAPTAWPGAIRSWSPTARLAELAGMTGLAPEEIRVVPNGVDLRRHPAARAVGPRRWSASGHARGLAAPADAVAPHAAEERGAGAPVVAAMRTAAAGRAHCDRPRRSATRRRGLPTSSSSSACAGALGLEGAAWFLSDEADGCACRMRMMDDLYRLAGQSSSCRAATRASASPSSRRPRTTAPDRLHGPAGTPQAWPATRPCTSAPMTTRRRSPAARILRQLDLDSDPARLAAAVRTGYRWDAIYRERIAPLLAPRDGRG